MTKTESETLNSK